MKLTILSDGKILVVGDGDFSFTVALVKHLDVAPHQVFTSNLETEASILHHAQASDNMSCLKDLGVSVFLEMDATDLHNHPVVRKERFDRIVFNFPLADRHNIKKNRSLLADFFSSCRSVLAPNGCVMVTLCKGQGGTPADNPIRSWHDSWQVVAMATNASFLLREVLPFNPTDFPEYHSVGFRFQDKSFNVTGALTHVFEEGKLVEDSDINICGVVHMDGGLYSCSSYVASHLKRNLLEEQINPVCILRQTIEDRLKADLSVNDVITESCNPIIPSHKSNLYRCSEDFGATNGSVFTSMGQPSKPDKNWKNCENLKIMAKTQLAHGVMESTITNADDASYVDNGVIDFLQSDRDNVYILVRQKKNEKSGRSEEDMELDNGEIGGDTLDESSGCHSSGGTKPTSTDSGEQPCLQESPGCSADNGTDSSSQVYHCRTSLLESLPDLCRVMDKTRRESSRNDSDDVLKVCGEEDKSPSMVNHSELNTPTAPCLVASGQSMLPCHITPSSSPIKHELLILHQISMDCVPISCEEYFDNISSKVLSLLHSLSETTNFSFVKESEDSPSPRFQIDGIEEIQLVGRINTTLTHSISKDETTENGRSYSEHVGLIFLSEMGGCSYHVTVLDLQKTVCQLCRMTDWRLLWSDSNKFTDQFKSRVSKDFFGQYRPFSLYPMKFVHDLSFWEQQQQEAETDSVSIFDVFALYNVIRYVAGDLVTNVSLIDVYEDSESKRKSRCYRLHFSSPDKCLPYVTSWKIQSRIRMEVARSLGVQLR